MHMYSTASLLPTQVAYQTCQSTEIAPSPFTSVTFCQRTVKKPQQQHARRQRCTRANLRAPQRCIQPSWAANRLPFHQHTLSPTLQSISILSVLHSSITPQGCAARGPSSRDPSAAHSLTGLPTSSPSQHAPLTCIEVRQRLVKVAQQQRGAVLRANLLRVSGMRWQLGCWLGRKLQLALGLKDRPLPHCSCRVYHGHRHALCLEPPAGEVRDGHDLRCSWLGQACCHTVWAEGWQAQGLDYPTAYIPSEALTRPQGLCAQASDEVQQSSPQQRHTKSSLQDKLLIRPISQGVQMN